MSLAFIKCPRERRKKKQDNISPPKKIFITKQILIKSSLVFNNFSEWRLLGWRGRGDKAEGNERTEQADLPVKSQVL